ncbi:MAG TPA: hypothetical protein PKA50_11410 [Gemmatimonadales bacterium]|nr:hypothetical protein [Gemmatimonadales bacterium]
MTQIEIVLARPDDPAQQLSLFYDPLPIPVARRYLEAVRECAEAGWPVKEHDRFHNFPNDHRDRAWISAELNRQIDLVNGWAPGTIPHRASRDMDQAHLNLLHTFFERYRGRIDDPPEFFRSASPAVQRALEDFNLLIHRYEDLVRNEGQIQRGRRPVARAVLTFSDPRPRYLLRDEDYRHFSRRRVFGTLNINYCETGKPIWDAFMDADAIVGDDNIRPLRHYSADCLLQFGPTTRLSRHLAEQAYFHAWWYGPWGKRLRQLGFYPHDPKTAVGYIPVGTLDRSRAPIAGRSETEIEAIVGRHQRFVRVAVG